MRRVALIIYGATYRIDALLRTPAEVFQKRGVRQFAEPVYRALGVTPIHPNPDHNATMRYVAPMMRYVAPMNPAQPRLDRLPTDPVLTAESGYPLSFGLTYHRNHPRLHDTNLLPGHPDLPIEGIRMPKVSTMS